MADLVLGQEVALVAGSRDDRDHYDRAYVAADAAADDTCEPEPAPTLSPPPASGGGPGSGPGGAWKNCTEAREHGATPVNRGNPGCGGHLDRDDDGIGCE